MSALNKFMVEGFISSQDRRVLDYQLAAVLIATPLVTAFDYKAAAVIALALSGIAVVRAVTARSPARRHAAR